MAQRESGVRKRRKSAAFVVKLDDRRGWSADFAGRLLPGRQIFLGHAARIADHAAPST
jgi:hypothetical protein